MTASRVTLILLILSSESFACLSLSRVLRVGLGVCSFSMLETVHAGDASSCEGSVALAADGTNVIIVDRMHVHQTVETCQLICIACGAEQPPKY